MRKLLLYIIIILSPVFLLKCNSHERAVNEELNIMAQGLNESAPVMLDKYTLFERAEVTSDNVFIYRYTVLNTSNPDSLIESVAKSLDENIKAEFASNPELNVFKENNVVIEYVYKDINNQTIRLIRINPEDYQ